MKKFNNSKKTQNKGFTIIETMIAMTIFLIVIMVGTTAILNAYSVGNKSRGMRSIMDNMSFVVEDMSRNIRTGYHYRCTSGPGDNNKETPLSGKDCIGLFFEGSNGTEESPTDQWLYYVENDKLFKSTNGGSNLHQLNPAEVQITNASFSVLGAKAPPEDEQQPFVIIRLTGVINYKNTETTFSIQNAISQRTSDLK